MLPSVYLETSFISYLTSRLNPQIVIAGHQLVTREWWKTRRTNFQLFVSPVVSNEASQGNPEASRKRMKIIELIPSLEITEEAIELAETLLNHGSLPEKASEDAAHISIATVHQMDYLLTWNCKHIANAEIYKKLQKVAEANGFQLPFLCTPEALMGG